MQRPREVHLAQLATRFSENLAHAVIFLQPSYHNHSFSVPAFLKLGLRDALLAGIGVQESSFV